VQYASKGPIAAALMMLSVAYAASEPAVVASKLKLRSGPGPAFGAIAVLPPGAKLDAEKCTDEWCRVKYGRQIGYVSRAFLKTGADSFASAVPAAAPAPGPAIAPVQIGPRIWQWHNSDWRNAHWRQLDWHNRLNGH
jgi:uncharacterized protein YraI